MHFSVVILLSAFTECQKQSCGRMEEELWSKVAVFYNPAASKAAIILAGDQIGVSVIRKNFAGSLDDLRHKTYLENVAKTRRVFLQLSHFLLPLSHSHITH